MRHPLTSLARRAAAAAHSRSAAVRTSGDAGMTTAEYAVGTVAAASLGGVLIACVRQPAVTELIADVIKGAISRFSGLFG